MEIKTLSAIRIVSFVYQEPYPGIEAGYNRIFSYAKESNLKTLGPSRELYFNDPAEVPEEELMTEVQMPVRTR
jgi:effector-binding domain-containing protein